MPKNKGKNSALSAVSHAFLAGTDGRCAQIRDVADRVMAGASDNHIMSTTANDALLTMYILPDNIPALFVPMNRALAAFGAAHIAADAITKKSTVGDVRELAYKACDAVCKPT